MAVHEWGPLFGIGCLGVIALEFLKVGGPAHKTLVQGRLSWWLDGQAVQVSLKGRLLVVDGVRHQLDTAPPDLEDANHQVRPTQTML